MIETEEHKRLVECLKTVIYPWRKFTICVDGLPGVGKSGLSRYLSWKLDMPSIETDIFIEKDSNQPSYRYAELKKAVFSRLKSDRPLIIEGIFLLSTLEKIGVDPSYFIYVNNSDADTGLSLREALEKYQNDFKPKIKATQLFDSEYILQH